MVGWTLGIVEDLVSWLQLHDARLRSLVERNRLSDAFCTPNRAYGSDHRCGVYLPGRGGGLCVRKAGKSVDLPRTITWDEVGHTLAFSLAHLEQPTIRRL